MDICIGIEKGRRSLIGKVFEQKRFNLVRVRSTMMKLWHHKCLCKVVALALNIYQFVFEEASEREAGLQERL